MKIKVDVSPKAKVRSYIFLNEASLQTNYGKIISPSQKKTLQEALKNKLISEAAGAIRLCPEVKELGHVFAVGMGKNPSKNDFRRAAIKTVRHAKKDGITSLNILVPEEVCVHRTIQGCVLGNYQFRLTNEKTDDLVASVTVVTRHKVPKQDIDREIALAAAQNYTRELVNLPPNLLNPETFLQKTKTLLKGSKVKLKVVTASQMKKMGMGSFLAVGQGSDIEPRMLVMEYPGGKKTDKPVALVGKGVTFDSGGYDLKPSKGMADMKMDMGGAGAVLGAMHYLAKTEPKVNVVGVVGLVENLINGKAYKPGDVITAMNGKTIEIGNTDAEGRLVLADCLTYTEQNYGPARMIDLATLTGACMVALGHEMAGIMSQNEALVADVQKAAEKADELVWPLPLNDFFIQQTKGKVSDLNNINDAALAGASMAGAFLANFVKDTPWIHIDIAGPAMSAKVGDNTIYEGATGVMVRTLVKFLEA